MAITEEQTEKIETMIEWWHERGVDAPLHVYLGLSWEEYALYVEQDVLPEDWPGQRL